MLRVAKPFAVTQNGREHDGRDGHGEEHARPLKARLHRRTQRTQRGDEAPDRGTTEDREERELALRPKVGPEVRRAVRPDGHTSGDACTEFNPNRVGDDQERDRPADRRTTGRATETLQQPGLPEQDRSHGEVGDRCRGDREQYDPIAVDVRPGAARLRPSPSPRQFTYCSSGDRVPEDSGSRPARRTSSGRLAERRERTRQSPLVGSSNHPWVPLRRSASGLNPTECRLAEAIPGSKSARLWQVATWAVRCAM